MSTTTKKESSEKKTKPKKRKAPKSVFFNIENTQYPSIKRCGTKLGWKITQSNIKNLLFWCDNNVGVEFCLNLKPWQFVNHFPGTFSISRKVELARNLDKMQKLFPKIYSFNPKTFILPMQSLDMKRYMQNVPINKRTFIIKPDLGAQGKGIFLVMDPDVVDTYTESAIAQHYIPPCLLEGLKFDFRIYALITSIDPLRVYIFKEGMTRFATEKYVKPRPSNLKDVFRHLTNYSVNKKNEKFQKPESSESDDSSHKRPLTHVFHELEQNGFDVEYAQQQIDQLIVLTIISGQPYIAHNYRTAIKVNDGKSRCFEILGFDVLLDKKLKPWLLEVNHSPSLLCESPFDKELKDNLITGAMKMLELNPHIRKKIVAQQHKMTLQRMYGSAEKGKGQVPMTLFDPENENEIAKSSGWRRIYPIPENSQLQTMYDEVIEKNKSLPIDGSNETVASRNRREAIQNRIKNKEKEEQKFVRKTKVKKEELNDLEEDEEDLEEDDSEENININNEEEDHNKKKISRIQSKREVLSKNILKKEKTPRTASKKSIISSAAKPGQPKLISKTPKSQLLLREVKLHKLVVELNDKKNV